ncbi:MAG: histidinol dehydrogenase [Acidobacteriota bacterium]
MSFSSGIFKTYKLASRRGEKALDRLGARGASGADAKTLRQARKIVDGVKRKGDAGLLDAVARFDGFEAATVARLARQPAPRDWEGMSPELQGAVDRAIESVRRFHGAHLPEGYTIDNDGVSLEEKVLPLRRVGLYVPGGRFVYPSSVLMTVIPAQLAGVEEIVVVTPPQAWQESVALRGTLARLGVTEVWAMGGAQAVAALAYGTESVERVDMIAGPGNVWVAAAKELVRGAVAVDREAGPSEVVIVADADAPVERVAADLLAQAEHDPLAMAVLVTPDRKLAKAVTAELGERLEAMEEIEEGGSAVARQSLAQRSLCLLVADAEEALQVAERIAPEHLQLMGSEIESMADRVRCAGATFVGADTPTVFGDYVAGPSHVLPTGGTARFSSGLGTGDFVRRSHTVSCSPEASRRLAADAAVLADVEGLRAHAASARLRTRRSES